MKKECSKGKNSVFDTRKKVFDGRKKESSCEWETKKKERGKCRSDQKSFLELKSTYNHCDNRQTMRIGLKRKRKKERRRRRKKEMVDLSLDAVNSHFLLFLTFSFPVSCHCPSSSSWPILATVSQFFLFSFFRHFFTSRKFFSFSFFFLPLFLSLYSFTSLSSYIRKKYGNMNVERNMKAIIFYASSSFLSFDFIPLLSIFYYFPSFITLNLFLLLKQTKSFHFLSIVLNNKTILF